MNKIMKRIMSGFLAMLTVLTTLFSNILPVSAASPSGNLSMWYASTSSSGEVSELKPGYNHGKVLYCMIDGNSAYCMNYARSADGDQSMSSSSSPMTAMSAEQEKLLNYCLYYGFNSTNTTEPNDDEKGAFIATQAMVWNIVSGIFGTGSDDSAAQKLCVTAPNPDQSFEFYANLKGSIYASYYATFPSFSSGRGSAAPTYELKWNTGSGKYEAVLGDVNGVLGNYDVSIPGYETYKNGNELVIATASVNTAPTLATLTNVVGSVDMISSCVYWETGKDGYQEFVSEKPQADPVRAYFYVKTEDIGFGDLYKTDESTGTRLAGAVYGIYTDSGCTNCIQTMTTDGNGYAKSGPLTAGTYYVREISAPRGYVISGAVHTLQVNPGQTTGIGVTDKEQKEEFLLELDAEENKVFRKIIPRDENKTKAYCKTLKRVELEY